MTPHLLVTSTAMSTRGRIVYLWLPVGAPLAPLEFATPFRAVVVAEEDPGSDRRQAICDWLAAAGCRYLMAWGIEASAWDDAMDWASLDRVNYADREDKDFVPTTWHDNDSLPEVFDFARQLARHPSLALDDLLVLHLSAKPAAAKMLELAQG